MTQHASMSKTEEWDRDKANLFMSQIVLRCGSCRANRINHDFEKYLKKELEMPESVVLAYEQFCLDTYDPDEWAGMMLNGLVARVEWLDDEVFCQVTHEIANPTSGFWKNLFKPDLPSEKKFAERTDSICQELRNGKITLNDAIYRWKQELLIVQNLIGADTAKEMGKRLKNQIKFYLDLFNAIAK